MKAGTPTDYETYHEIMDELLSPIESEGLDVDTLKRLYESKLVYLENLRVKCFMEMNRKDSNVYFTIHDYRVILSAIDQTHGYLHDLVLTAVTCSLKKRFISAG